MKCKQCGNELTTANLDAEVDGDKVGITISCEKCSTNYYNVVSLDDFVEMEDW